MGYILINSKKQKGSVMAPFKDALRESAALQKELQLKGAEAYFSFIKTVVSLLVGSSRIERIGQLRHSASRC